MGPRSIATFRSFAICGSFSFGRGSMGTHVALIYVMSGFLSNFCFTSERPNVLRGKDKDTSIKQGSGYRFIQTFRFASVRILVSETYIPFSQRGPSLRGFCQFCKAYVRFTIRSAYSNARYLSFSRNSSTTILFAIAVLRVSFR